MKNEHPCQGRKMGTWRDYGCGARGVVERDDKWYCRRCDPVAKKAREEAHRHKQSQKYRTEWEHKDAIYRVTAHKEVIISLLYARVEDLTEEIMGALFELEELENEERLAYQRRKDAHK
jgi:hypothetical protein